MSDRVVYGNSHSLNGWPMVDQGSCVWVKVPGTNPTVSLQIREGEPAKILGAFAADFNAYVEPLRDADSACWTPTNSVATSNHLSGTALDLNWSSHPFRVNYAGFDAAKIATMRELLAWYEEMIWWGQDWTTPKDAMHLEMHDDTYGSQNFARVESFIARKIRADGFSTFRRGGTVTPPPVIVAPPAPSSNQVDVLVRATGVTTAKAQEILVGVVNGLRDSQCTNVNRIAMWLAQIGHESAGFNATEEYEDGDESTDRWKYKGRTWIQITWRTNYAGLSQWAFSKGLIPTATYFVDNPKLLAEIQYAGLGPAWYWTVARPQINSLCDQRNLTAVTQAINGGQNGAADRKNRYDRALALGDQLLALATQAPPTQGEDEMSAEDVARLERKIDALVNEWGPNKRGPSRSFLATDGAAVDSPLGFLYNIDGNVWTQQLTWAYLFDVPLAIDVVTSVAKNGAYEGSWVKSNEFNAWLNEFGQAYCQGLINFKNALAAKLTSKAPAAVVATGSVTAPTPVTNVTNVVDTRALEAEIARLSEQFNQLKVAVNNQPAPYVPPVSTELVARADSTGDKIQRAVDSNMDYTDHVLTMDAAQRTALTRALTSINPSNGDPA